MFHISRAILGGGQSMFDHVPHVIDHIALLKDNPKFKDRFSYEIVLDDMAWQKMPDENMKQLELLDTSLVSPNELFKRMRHLSVDSSIPSEKWKHAIDVVEQYYNRAHEKGYYAMCVDIIKKMHLISTGQEGDYNVVMDMDLTVKEAKLPFEYEDESHPINKGQVQMGHYARLDSLNEVVLQDGSSHGSDKPQTSEYLEDIGDVGKVDLLVSSGLAKIDPDLFSPDNELMSLRHNSLQECKKLIDFANVIEAANKLKINVRKRGGARDTVNFFDFVFNLKEFQKSESFCQLDRGSFEEALNYAEETFSDSIFMFFINFDLYAKDKAGQYAHPLSYIINPRNFDPQFLATQSCYYALYTRKAKDVIGVIDPKEHFGITHKQVSNSWTGNADKMGSDQKICLGVATTKEQALNPVYRAQLVTISSASEKCLPNPCPKPSLKDTLLNICTGINNLGTGNKKDPMRPYYSGR